MKIRENPERKEGFLETRGRRRRSFWCENRDQWHGSFVMLFQKPSPSPYHIAIQASLSFCFYFGFKLFLWLSVE